MTSPLVSVIIPIFRVEKYLDRCVKSVMRQSYENIEIILVDDGSDDECPRICDSYDSVDKRVSVYHKTNGGLSDARNYGIDRAHGDYLVFVDSDDYISADMIKKLMESAVLYNADVVICAFDYVDENGVRLNSQKELCYSGKFSNEQIFHFYQKENVSWILGVAWNKLYKSNLFKSIRYPVGKLHEDDFISFLIYDNARSVSIVDDYLYHYTQRKQSIMGDALNVRHSDSAFAYILRIKFAEKTGRLYLIPKAEKQAFSVLFSIAIRVNDENDKRYLMPYIEEYKKIYIRYNKKLRLSFIDRLKRTSLINDGFLLKICGYIKKEKKDGNKKVRKKT